MLVKPQRSRFRKRIFLTVRYLVCPSLLLWLLGLRCFPHHKKLWVTRKGEVDQSLDPIFLLDLRLATG